MTSEVYRVEIPVVVHDRTEPGFSTAQRKVGALDAAAAGLDRRLLRVSQTTSSVGRGLTTWTTRPIVAALGGAGYAAIKFESDFAGVTKTVDGTRAQMRGLERDIRAMARVVPATTGEIAGVAEQAGQLGIRIPRIMGFTRTMVDLGETTNLEANVAADSLARLANITEMPQTQFGRLGSTVVDLGNKLAATEEEIVTMSARIAGAGHQVGMTEPQILAWAGALSSVGIHAEMGGSAISRVITTIDRFVAKGGRDLEIVSRVSGQSAQEFRRAWEQDASGALTGFFVGLERMQDMGIRTLPVLDALGFSEIRVSDTIRRATNASDLFTRSQEIGNAAWGENIALTEEAEKRYATTQAELERTRNRINDVGITLGRQLLPVLEDDVIPVVRDFVDMIQEADPSTRRLAIQIALWGAAFGPALRVVGALTGGLGRMVQLTRWLIGAPWTRIVGGVAAVGGAGALVPTVAGGAAAGIPAWLARRGVSVPATPATGGFGSLAVQTGTGAAGTAGAGLLARQGVLGAAARGFTRFGPRAAGAAAVVGIPALLYEISEGRREAEEQERRSLGEQIATEGATAIARTRARLAAVRSEWRSGHRGYSIGFMGNDPAARAGQTGSFAPGRSYDLEEEAEDLAAALRTATAQVRERYIQQFDTTPGVADWIMEVSGRRREGQGPDVAQIGQRVAFYERMGFAVDAATRSQVSNLVAVGDADGAYALLNERMQAVVDENSRFVRHNQDSAGAVDLAGEKAEAAAARLEGFERAERSAGDVARDLALDVGRLAQQIAGFVFPDFGGAGARFTSGRGGMAGGSFQHRAGGGPTPYGQSFIVGERGPELFRAPPPRIVPNYALRASGAGGGVQIVANVNIDARGSTDGKRVGREAADELMDQIASQLADALGNRG